MSRLDGLDIANLPPAEDEQFEYKSSTTTFDVLKDKLPRAASGFWNAGGGLFIVGVNGDGKPDGGFPVNKGRTSTRDWIDQVLKDVAPVGPYAVRIFPHDPASGLNIAANHAVIAVEFEESPRPPHMAADHKYYIRAGAHTLPASHYIVEALWARRRVQRPHLAHSMRFKPEASDIIQLAVLSLTDEPAVNISFSLDPLPEMWKDVKGVFPLKIPLLDRTTPFFLDVTTYCAADERLGKGVQLRIEYEDLARNRYDYTATLDTKSIAPWRIGTPAHEMMARSLESIDKTLKALPKAVDELQEEVAHIRGHLETVQGSAFPRTIGDPGAVAATLSDDAKALLVAAKGKGTIIYSPYIGGTRLSAGKSQLISNERDHREIAKWKAAVTELRDAGLITGVFRRGASTIFPLSKLGYDVSDKLKDEGGTQENGDGTSNDEVEITE